MLVQTIVIAAVGLLTSLVSAGSRHWEAGIPLMGRQINNGTHGLHRRAISFRPSGGEQGHYTWPDKKIKYCYADALAKEKLKGPLEAAMQSAWEPLLELGFSYQEVSLDKCQKDRINHLMVHYNDQGKLATTVGKQPVDEQWNRENPGNEFVGPFMHLSTKADVGMLDIVANVAHELGHAWGLYHEHQNPNFWTTSIDDQLPDDPNGPMWGNFPGKVDVFRPSQFDCTALSDYPAALAKAQALQAKGGEWSSITRTFCTNQGHATKVGFSAKDWLPLSLGVPIIADPEFDPDSIMLYPSGAGGRRPGNGEDGRQNVLTLAGGTEMKRNVQPSGRDVDRLRVLYSTNIADIQELHIRGAKKSTFDKIKGKMPKFGSAKDKGC